MTPHCLSVRCDAPVAAEAALSHALGARWDVQLVPYRRGRFLVPPDVARALEQRFPGESAAQALGRFGLHDVLRERMREVVDWLTTNAAEWSQRLEQPAEGAADPSARTWHLDMCRVREAWEVAGGVYGLAWQDIAVGQIDTGYTEHPALGPPGAGSVDPRRARTFDGGAPPGDGRDTLTGGSAGHGTASGSLITAFAFGSALCLGVAPRVPLVPARIHDCVVIDGRAAEFEAALHYLVDEAQVAVVNVSMGTFARAFAPAPLRRAVDHAYERGVHVVGAAGNVPVRGWPAYPARLPRCLAVGGVTREGRRWGVSSYGDWVDLAAPAKNVFRATVRDGGAYDYSTGWGGTTFSAAMTSGAAALWRLVHRDEIARRYRQPWQQVEAFRAMARRTAHRPAVWDDDAGLGTGILDVLALMDARNLPAAADLQQR